MSDVHLRGDLVRPRAPTSTDAATATAAAAGSKPASSTTAISIGKTTIISPSTVLRPPTRLSRGQWTPYPLKIGDQVFIGPQCVVSAALIHSHVHVGAGCVLMPFCIVRENVRILPGSVVPANMVIPPNSVVAGRPARVVGEVGEGWGVNAVGEEWVEGGDLRDVVRGVR
jgi:dynactin-5